ncbi:ABC transporter substrate-binding protein [Nocardia lasii]|uniref:ABC transporter substrate-binding protein n=1 Tax=Nocardia lasii TaxID=1616107 RepID=A0ABW1JUA6_9NOCA
MRRGTIRLITVLATAAVTTSVVAGCSTKNQVPSIGYAVDAAVTTYNGASTLGASSGTGAVFGRVLTGFFYTGPDGQQVADTDVGTAKEVPGETQTVQYRLNPDGVYSDGVQTSCDDLVLAWMARSGKHTRTGERGQVPMFDAASTLGYDEIERIDCQPGSKDATVVFRPGKHYLPWRTLFAAAEMMPAHVVAKAVGVPDVVNALQGGDGALITRIADFWNTGWTLAPGALDLARFPSSGPYRLESFSARDGVVLVANDKWWGDAPETKRIVVWPRGTDYAAKSKENALGVIDLGAGSVADLKLDGFDARTVAGRGAEQLVLASDGVFSRVEVRRAFAQCVPRQALFDTLGKAGEPPTHGLGASVLNSRVVQQDSLYYPAVVSGAERYRGADIPAATATLASSGTAQPTVRIGYRSPDARRAQTVSMIAESCRGAGITVLDAGAPDFSPVRLPEGAVDAVLAGTGAAPGPAGSSAGVAAFAALRPGSGLDFGGFANGRYDAITDQLAGEANSTTTLNLLTEAENLLWAQVPSIPLFATPRTIAFGHGMQNGIAGPTQAGTGWNMDRWVLQR